MRRPRAEESAAAIDVAAVALSPEGRVRAPSPRAPSEAQLADCVRRMAERDQKALALLYDATANRIYSVALHFVHHAHIAEEVVSDVYFQAWNEASRYDSHRGSVRTWLLVCCRSRAMDWLRRKEMPRSPIDPDELEDAGYDDAAAGMNLMESMQRRGAVHHALQQIEPLQRQLISLSFFRGYSHAEIASREQMPLGTVKTQIRAALQRLRLALPGLHE